MNFHLQRTIRAMLYAAPPSNVATAANKLAKTAIQETKMAKFRRRIMVPARAHVVDSTQLAATLARTLAMGKSHVGFVWSHAKFDVVIHVVVRSATSLAFLVLKIAPGLVHTEARADCHAQCHVTCFHALSAVP